MLGGFWAVFFVYGGMDVKIWVLVENTACREGLVAEHGLSLYIETGGH